MLTSTGERAGWQIRTSNWFVRACDLVWPRVPRGRPLGISGKDVFNSVVFFCSALYHWDMFEVATLRPKGESQENVR